MPRTREEQAAKINQQSFVGGLAIDPKLGINGALGPTEAMDFRQKASQMSVLPGARAISTALSDLPTASVQTPDGMRYLLGDQGYVYKVDASNVVTQLGQLNSNGAAGIVYNQQSDQIYLAGQQTVSLYGQVIAGAPGFKKDQFGPSASVANGTVNMFDSTTNAYDIPRNNAASIAGGITPSNYASQVTNTLANTYTLPSAVSEATGNFCPFIPDIEPFYSIAVYFTQVSNSPISKAAGTGSNVTGTGTQAWTNPGNITASDSTYATEDTSLGDSNYLEGTNFGFNIPSSATILGVQVQMKRHQSAGGGSSVIDKIVKLVKGGVVSGTDHSGQPWNATTDTTVTYGGAADMWGLSLTPADVNASNFGVALAVSTSGAGGVASVDYVTIQVTYRVVVTLTLHDSLNNNLGTVNLNSDAMVVGWNNFVFSAPGVRAIPNAFATGTAAGYHFHLTSPDTTKVATINAADLTGANFLLFAYRLVQTNNGWHPMAIFGQYLCIGNGPYLSTYNFANDGGPNNGQWVRHQLSLDYGYEVCGLSVNNDKLVIAAEKRSTNASRSYQDGYLYFWDGANVNFNYKVEVPMGAPYSVSSFNGITYFVCAGSLYAYGGGNQIIKVRYIGYQNTDYLGAADGTIVNPHMMDTRYGLLLIGYPSKTTIPTIKYGVYSWGSVELSYPNSFGYSYAISNAQANSRYFYTGANNLQIGMIANFVDSLYVSWRQTVGGVTTYALDVVDNTSSPAPVFSAQNLIWDGGVRWKIKRGLRVKVTFLPLPANTTLTINYTLDRGTQQNASASAAQGDTSAVIEIDTNFYEVAWGFAGTTSSATSPAVITGWTCEVDTLEGAQDLQADDIPPSPYLEAE